MYHMKKKFTRKVQRSTGIVNKKKNNRKRVTKKVKLSKKNLNKKNKRRPRIVKKGGNADEIPASNDISAGGSSYKKKTQHGGEEPHANGGVEEFTGGSSCSEHDQTGGSHCGKRNHNGGVHEQHYVGGNKQHGGNGCGCGV